MNIKMLSSKLITIYYFCGIFLVYFLTGADGTEINTRIVGGQIVKNRTEFAYKVSLHLRLSSSDFHYCGGSIITPKHILTAAYCFFIDSGIGTINITAKNIYVVGGDLNQLIPTENTVKKNVSKIFLHQNYTLGVFENNIAICELSSQFNINNITLAVIKISIRRPKEGTECTVSGWGNMDKEGSKSYDLRYLNVKIINNEVCKNVWNNTAGGYGDSLLCAGDLDGGKGVCTFDYGGPLVQDGYQVGIVSSGTECGAKGVPGVYTDVTVHNSWIKTIIGLEI